MRTARLPTRRASRAAYGQPGHGRSALKMRLMIGLAVVGFAVFSYFRSAEYNPITGEKQYISLTPEQEIAMGLQAAPQMAQQHGGLHPDPEAQALVDQVGQRLVQRSDAGKLQWKYEFHLLRDPKTVNAFALPGGQMFITAALFSRLETEGQLAGVLGHEIGHVVARHSAQRIAKSSLTQGLIGAVLVASGGGGAAQTAQMIGQMVNMKYGREDELESDTLGVRFMADAGYDPRALKGVMRILAEASGGSGQAEFMSTHPSPENRVAQIEAAIKRTYPGGVPAGLVP